MRKLFFLLFFIGSILRISAQDQKRHDCATDELHLKLLKENSKYKKSFDENNLLWQKYANEKRNESTNKLGFGHDNDFINLTVVFHNMVTANSLGIMIDYDDVVDKLNERYFNSNISFCRALTDINHDIYDGNSINHTSSISSGLDKNEIDQINGLVFESQSQNNPAKFPTNKYINIYIVDEIKGSTAGFAFLPPSHGMKYDGIYIERKFLASGKKDDIVVLVHEMGHYLGLFHVFGICDPDTIANFPQCSCDDGNCLFNGDMVCDTPASMLNMSSCDLTLDSCPSSVGLDAKDNYMDYGDYTCKNKFTNDQKTRMRFMLDPLWGARNSLLNNRTCINCDELNLCTFSINVPSEIQSNQVAANTSLIFSQSTNSCANNPDLAFTWSLLNIDTGDVVDSNQEDNFNVVPTLVGNYKVVLIAESKINSECFETVEYSFQVLPANIIDPATCTTDWNSWETVSYTGGWKIKPGNNITDYAYATTVRQVPGDANNFSTIVPSAFNDANFPNAIAPTGVNNIYRVGRVINSSNALPDGAASYMKVKLKPTKENCKFRIYYLGMIDGNASTYTDPKFGFKCQMKINSPVFDPSIVKAIGESEWGYIMEPSTGTLPFSMNDFEVNGSVNFLNHPSYYGINYSAMDDWQYKDVDFSEFASLNDGNPNNFEVTLTFYARSNDQAVAKKHCYSYFAVQCLGGGLPKNIVWEPSNIDNPCEYPAQESCYKLLLPRPENCQSIRYWYGNNYGFANVISLKESFDDINYVSVTPVVEYDETGSNAFLKLCMTQNTSYFYKYFEITYKVLNQTFVRKIRISNEFYHSNPPCENPALVDNVAVYGGVIPVGTPKYYVICPGSQPYPVLNYEKPCFSVLNDEYVYEWYFNNALISGVNTPSLNLNNFSYLLQNSHCNNNVVRKVIYKDPYCQTPTRVDGEIYRIYNKVGHSLQMTNRVNDFCAFEEFRMTITNLYLLGCGAESVFEAEGLTTENNMISLRLYKEQNGINPLTSSQDFSFANMSSLYNDVSFTFSNQSTTLGVPIYNPGSYTVYLRVTYQLYGCTRSFDVAIPFSVRPTAVAGSIKAVNTCLDDNIISENDGFTNSSYRWEYSVDGGTTYSVIAGQTAKDLYNFHLYIPYPYTALIRRVSLPFPNCPGEAMTAPVSVIQLTKVTPTFDIPETYCFGTPIAGFLPTTSINFITGTWNPPLNAPLTSNTIFTFTPDSGQCAIAVSRLVRVITMYQPSNINICNALAPAATQNIQGFAFSSPSGQGNVTYSWSRTNTGSTNLPLSGQSNVSAFPTFTATNVSALRIITITVTPRVGNCNGVPVTFTITQNPVSTITQNGIVSVCNNENVAISFSSSNATAYSWVIDPLTPVDFTPNVLTPPNTLINFSNSPPFNITPSIPSSAPQNANYTFNIIVTPFANGCVGTPKTIVVTIRPKAVIVKLTKLVNGVYVDIPNNNIVICSGGYVPRIYPKTDPISSPFTWNLIGNIDNIGMPFVNGSGSTKIDGFIPSVINDTNAPLTNTIQIIPSNMGCGIPFTYTITVLPRAKMNDVSDVVLCSQITQSNQAVDVEFSSLLQGGVLSYSFTSVGDSNNFPSSGNAVQSSYDPTKYIVSFVPSVNSTNAPLVRTVTVTPKVDGCSGDSKTFKVVVMPKPVITTDSSFSISVCANQTKTITLSNNIPTQFGQVEYVYAINTNSQYISDISFVNGVFEFKGVNETNVNKTVTVLFTPIFHSSEYEGVVCNGVQKAISITIYPRINIVDYQSTFCQTGQSITIPKYVFTENPDISGVLSSWTCTTLNNLQFTTLSASNGTTSTIPAFAVNNNTNSPIVIEFQIRAWFNTSRNDACDVLKVVRYIINPLPVIIANPDVSNVVDPNGSVILFNTSLQNSILANDTYNGTIANPSSLVLTQVSANIPGISMDSLGQITVASTVANGTYQLTYKICDAICNTTCSQSTVTINVSRSIPAIIANNDEFNICFTGVNPTLANILLNDTINGNTANGSNVIINIVDIVSGNFEVNTDGTLNLYDEPVVDIVFHYTICDANNPTICSNVAEVVIHYRQCFVAWPDFGTVTSPNGGAITLQDGNLSVLTNDVANFETATLNNVILTQISTTNSGVYLDVLTGEVHVDAQVQNGTYEIVYQICDLLNPSNCSSASVIIEVILPISSDLKGDLLPTRGLCYTTTGYTSMDSLYHGVFINGVPANSTNSIITPIFPVGSGLVLNSGGYVVAPDGALPQVYGFPYTVCTIDGVSCVNLTCGFKVVSPLQYINGESLGFNIDESNQPYLCTGRSRLSVLSNDSLLHCIDQNFVPVVVGGNVTVSVEPVTNTKPFYIDPVTYLVEINHNYNGIVSESTTCELSYTICDMLYPNICVTKTVAIEWSNRFCISPNELHAVDDHFVFSVYSGNNNLYICGSNRNVLNNDYINLNYDTSVPWSVGVGQNGNCVLTVTPNVSCPYTIDPLTGWITGNLDYYLSATPIPVIDDGGVYVLHYQLCENDYPLSCSSGTVTILRNDGASCYYGAIGHFKGSGKSKESFESVMILPNPSKGIFNINFKDQLKEETFINVYNLLGQKVYETKVNGVVESQIDLSNYPSGNYVIKISNSEQTISKTLIKE